MGLPTVVLTPFVGAHNLFGIGYCGRPVEALSECVSDQGFRRGMVTADPTMDITQQLHPLLDEDVALQGPGVALPIEFAINNGKGLGAMHELPSLRLIHRQRLMEEVVEVRHPPVGQRVRLIPGSSLSSMTSGSNGADGWLAPEPRAGGPPPAFSGSS